MNESLILNQFASSAIVVYLIQVLKNARWFPWIKQETARLNRFVAVAAAFLVSIGVHTSFDHVTGTLVVTGLTIPGLAQGLWHWINSIAMQETIYKVHQMTKASTQASQAATVAAATTQDIKAVVAQKP